MCVEILIIIAFIVFGPMLAILAAYFLVFFDCDRLERIGLSLKTGLVVAGVVLFTFSPIFLFYCLGLL